MVNIVISVVISFSCLLAVLDPVKCALDETTLEISGLFTDCLQDSIGPRGICTGICVGNAFFTPNSQAMDNLQQCMTPTVFEFTSQVMRIITESSHYKDVYDFLERNTESFCSVTETSLRCVRQNMMANCKIGEEFLEDFEVFIKSHLGCQTQNPYTWAGCLMNPEFIKKEEIGICVQNVLASSLLQGFPAAQDDIGPILSYIRQNKDGFCKLAEDTVQCVTHNMEAHCKQDGMEKILNDQVNGFLKVLGCKHDSYHDLIDCGMDYSMWIGIMDTCDLTELSSIDISPELLSSSDSTICKIQEALDCIGARIQVHCPNKWIADSYQNIKRPIQDFLDFHNLCYYRPNKNHIYPCSCIDAEYPVKRQDGGVLDLLEANQCAHLTDHPVWPKCSELVPEVTYAGDNSIGLPDWLIPLLTKSDVTDPMSEQTANEIGLLVDCIQDIAGSRGICTGICLANHMSQNPTAIVELMQCLTSSVPSEISNIFKTNALPTQYQDIDNTLLADTTIPCNMMKQSLGCIRSRIIMEQCQTGEDFLDDFEAFFTFHMGCKCHMAHAWIACLTNPGFLNNKKNKICVQTVQTSPLVQGFPTPADVGEILPYIQQNKNGLCKLAEDALSCMTHNLEGDCKQNLVTEIIHDQINGFLKILGCNDDSYYDLIDCGLGISMWTEIMGTCKLMQVNTSSIGPEILSSSTCTIQEALDCIGDRLKYHCPNNWIAETYHNIKRPIQDFLDVQHLCKDRPKKDNIYPCSCTPGGSSTGQYEQCSDIQDWPQCSANKEPEARASRHSLGDDFLVTVGHCYSSTRGTADTSQLHEIKDTYKDCFTETLQGMRSGGMCWRQLTLEEDKSIDLAVDGCYSSHMTKSDPYYVHEVQHMYKGCFHTAYTELAAQLHASGFCVSSGRMLAMATTSIVSSLYVAFSLTAYG